MCQKEKKSWKKIQNLDRQVLIRLGLKKGAKILAEDIPYLIEEKLGDAFTLKNICRDCEWKEVCSWFVSRKIKNVAVKKGSFR